jgi:hypothetical protein
MYNILSIGRTSVFVMPCLFHCSCFEWLFNELEWGGAEGMMRERERDGTSTSCVGALGFRQPLLLVERQEWRQETHKSIGTTHPFRPPQLPFDPG